MVAGLFIGAEINGARRWLHLGGYSLQPSEFAKPAFVVSCAWLFAEGRPAPRHAGTAARRLLYCRLFAGLLVLQPDVGQTLLVSLVWGTLFFCSPASRCDWFSALRRRCAAGLSSPISNFGTCAGASTASSHPTAGRQLPDRPRDAVVRRGRLLRQGPGEGTIKTVLPDAHTDFIFAVIAEEYGVLACLVLLGLFAFVVMRAFSRHVRAGERCFAALAIAGLALLFVLQAIINMGVNVGLVAGQGHDAALHFQRRIVHACVSV